jgi:anti-sigma-K factor RskA
MTEDDDIDGLTGEYVLGSLDPAERADINARRRADMSLARAIEAWQCRLYPLSEAAPGISPPSHFFGSILSRISGETGRSKGSAQMVALHPNRSWRPISIVGGASARLRTPPHQRPVEKFSRGPRCVTALNSVPD